MADERVFFEGAGRVQIAMCALINESRLLYAEVVGIRRHGSRAGVLVGVKRLALVRVLLGLVIILNMIHVLFQIFPEIIVLQEKINLAPIITISNLVGFSVFEIGLSQSDRFNQVRFAAEKIEFKSPKVFHHFLPTAVMLVFLGDASH